MDYDTLSPQSEQARVIQNNILDRVIKGKATPLQIPVALEYLRQPHISYNQAVGLVNGIFKSESRRTSPEYQNIATAYIAARVHLAIAEPNEHERAYQARKSLRDPYTLQGIDPHEMLSAVRVNLETISQMHKRYIDTAMDQTDTLISLTKGIVRESYDHVQDERQLEQWSRQKGVTLSHLNLQAKRWDAAYAGIGEYPTSNPRKDLLDKSQILAEILSQTPSEDLNIGIISPLLRKAKSVSEVENDAFIVDNIQLTLAKGILNRPESYRTTQLFETAKALLANMDAFREGSEALTLINSVFGNQDKYAEMAIGILPERTVRFLERMVKHNPKDSKPTERYDVLKIDFYLDLVDMLAKREMLLSPDIIDSIFSNFEEIEDRQHYLNLVVNAVLLKRPKKMNGQIDLRETDTLNKLLTDHRVTSLFGNLNEYLKSDLYLNWFSLITTGLPLPKPIIA